MRIIVFFDLPVTSYKERKDYQKFRKLLINEGFIMMQESVYCKLALNLSVVKSEMLKLEKHKPHNGNIAILTITEKQFASIQYLVGEKSTETIDSDSRLIIL